MFRQKMRFWKYVGLCVCVLVSVAGQRVGLHDAHAAPVWVVPKGDPVAVVYYKVNTADACQNPTAHPSRCYLVHNGIALADLRPDMIRTPLGHVGDWPNETPVCFHGKTDTLPQHWVRVATERYLGIKKSLARQPFAYSVGRKADNGNFLRFKLDSGEATTRLSRAIVLAKQGPATVEYSHYNYVRGSSGPVHFVKDTLHGNFRLRGLNTDIPFDSVCPVPLGEPSSAPSTKPSSKP